MSEFSCWRCPQCIRWRLLEWCLLWFSQSHQMCHLGQNLPGPSAQRAASVFNALRLSTVLPVPLSHLFQSNSPAPHSASTFAPDRACPPIPFHHHRPPSSALLHSRLPNPQNKSVGWGWARQYPVNNGRTVNQRYQRIFCWHISEMSEYSTWSKVL